MSQVIDRGPAWSQVIDRGRQGVAGPYSQVIDRGPAFSQVIDRGSAFGQGYTFGGSGAGVLPAPAPKGGGMPGLYSAEGNPTPGPNGGAPPPPPVADPFEDWYKNTIQANPNKYDTNRSKAQWQAWFPLWDKTSQGFKSSKVDVNGNPIEGNSFEHPDACPPGMAAYGQNACAPVGYKSAGGGGGGGGFDGSGYNFGAGGFQGQGWSGWPTGVTEENDPGYQFRLSQARKSLEASAASRGVLATGGTLDAILRQGQDYASSEFGNVWNRAKDRYTSAWDQYRFAMDEKFRQKQLEQEIELAALNNQPL